MVVDPSVVTYQLVLEYTFTLEAPESVTPSAGRVNGALYESPWSAMLLLVHDEQRRLVGTSDAFPSTLKLAAGTYTARLQVRHTDAKVLNTMRSTTLRLKRPLSKPVKVPVFDSLASAMLRKGSFGTAQLKAGTRYVLYAKWGEQATVHLSGTFDWLVDICVCATGEWCSLQRRAT